MTIKKVHTFLLALLTFLVINVKGQDTKLILGAKAHIGNGKVINNSLIGIKGKKISIAKNALVTSYDTTEWDTVIYAKGKHVYPGFIAPNSKLGLVEIGAVRATKDYNEVGSFTPNARSITSYNTDSRIIPTIKTNGVLMAQITPKGGKISGTSSVVKFGERNWDSSIVRLDDGIHVFWPETFSKKGWWAKPGANEKNKKYQKQIKSIHTFFEKAKANAAIPFEKQKEKDLKYEAMRRVFNGDKTVYFHCDYVPQMNSIITLCNDLDIPKRVIVGAKEGHLIAERLKENDFSLMIGRTHSLPSRPDASIGEAYKLPVQLHKKNILFCFENKGRMAAMNTRNLPFNAGSAVGYGLPEEAAVEALTLSAAKILGIDNQYGSLEAEKNATLFISEGNALEMMSNKVIIALIDGRFISLDNHQKKAYRKYKRFYQQQK